MRVSLAWSFLHSVTDKFNPLLWYDVMGSRLFKNVKPMAFATLHFSGFFKLMRYVQRDRVTILMYHRFSEKEEPFKLHRKVFDRQLSYLRRKYSIISFSEYVHVLQYRQESLPPNPLILTIDDGYQDNYECAYPILKKYNAPATIFLTTDFISRKAWLWSNRLEYILKNTSKTQFSFPIDSADQIFQVDTFAGWHQTQLALFNYCRGLLETQKNEVLAQLAEYLRVKVPEEATNAFAPLTWDHIRAMQAGGIEYGAHSCSHAIMSRLSDKEVDRELRVSKKEIENNTDAKVDVFCYPNGQSEDISSSVVEQVQRNGYHAAVTTTTGFNYPDNFDPFFLKRISLGGAEQASLIAHKLTRRNHVG